MKLKKNFIVSLFLLAIIAMGAVSASEDISDDTITSIEPTDEVISESVDLKPTEQIITETVEDEPTEGAIIQSVEDEPTEGAVSQAVEEEISKSSENSQEVLTDTDDDFYISSYDVYGDIKDQEVIFIISWVEKAGGNNDKNGTMKIFVNDETSPRIQLPLENGYFDKNNVLAGHLKGINITNLGIDSYGVYDLKVTFYDNSTKTETVLKEMKLRISYIGIVTDYPQVITKGLTGNVTLPSDFTGKVYLIANDKELGEIKYSTNQNNEKVATLIVNPYDLRIGRNSIIIRTEDAVLGNTERESIVMCRAEIILPTQVIVGDKYNVLISVPDDITGTVYVYNSSWDDDVEEEYDIGKLLWSAKIVNGIANVTLTASSVGEQYFYISYNTTKGIYFDHTSTYINKSAAKIVANAYSAYYNKGTYSVKVYDKYGKLASNVAVVFKINGKKAKTVKTNSKGIAKFKIPTKYVPKTYKITATALGLSVTKKLVIKQVLKLKKVKVKKSAKKLVITATLKEGKKALKGKKIIFIFKGKKYTAKTNKKGIAKITIKKSVLKKLKVGKKVTYKATYLKDTVKRTVKVKK